MAIESSPGLSVEVVRLDPIPDDQVPPGHTAGFAYTISVNNHSDRTVQLIGRKWMIRHEGGELETVEGDGVVGLQPVIPPGESHVYTSFCLLKGPSCAMWGFYTGKDDADTPVIWQIPKFVMTAEEAIDDDWDEDDLLPGGDNFLP